VIVEMWDGAASRPIRRAEDLTADNGRGLLLVASLARDWGYYRIRVGDLTNGSLDDRWEIRHRDRRQDCLLRAECEATDERPAREVSAENAYRRSTT
jgi:hypothetical protein